MKSARRLRARSAICCACFFASSTLKASSPKLDAPGGLSTFRERRSEPGRKEEPEPRDGEDHAAGHPAAAHARCCEGERKDGQRPSRHVREDHARRDAVGAGENGPSALSASAICAAILSPPRAARGARRVMLAPEALRFPPPPPARGSLRSGSSGIPLHGFTILGRPAPSQGESSATHRGVDRAARTVSARQRRTSQEG
jgi:hypothetical protein